MTSALSAFIFSFPLGTFPQVTAMIAISIAPPDSDGRCLDDRVDALQRVFLLTDRQRERSSSLIAKDAIFNLKSVFDFFLICTASCEKVFEVFW